MSKKKNAFLFDDKFCYIELFNSSDKLVGIAKISKEDFSICKNIYWRLSEFGYARGYFDGREILLHKLITGTDRTVVIDHIDRDKLNCSRENLRFANKSINTLNRNAPKNSKTKFAGVSYDSKRKKYRAYSKKDGHQHFWGYYDNIEDAILARKNGIKRLFPVLFDDIGGDNE